MQVITTGSALRWDGKRGQCIGFTISNASFWKQFRTKFRSCVCSALQNFQLAYFDLRLRYIHTVSSDRHLNVLRRIQMHSKMYCRWVLFHFIDLAVVTSLSLCKKYYVELGQGKISFHCWNIQAWLCWDVQTTGQCCRIFKTPKIIFTSNKIWR